MAAKVSSVRVMVPVSQISGQLLVTKLLYAVGKVKPVPGWNINCFTLGLRKPSWKRRCPPTVELVSNCQNGEKKQSSEYYAGSL